jgi:hypothetical protein
MSTFNMDPVSQVVQQERRRADARPEQSSSPNYLSSAAQLGFTPSLERRRVNFAGFVRNARTLDPAGADHLASLLGSGDIIAHMEPELAKVGLHTNNLADAYALWWINCWSAVHGDLTTPDRTTIDAVKAQAARALLAGGQTASASDTLKQQFAEAILIQALLLDASLQQAKGEAKQLKLLSSAANKGALEMGLDMQTMALTPYGFAPRR